MPFNTVSFLVFLPTVFLVFAAAGPRLRPTVLLVASVAFYAALGAPHLLVALAFSVGSSWWVALRLARATDGRARWLSFGIIANLSVLVLVKYLPALGPATGAWISVGVSYFVFQAISYLIDVHLEVVEAEGNLWRVALAMAFFPKLLQGPIERAGDLLPQLRVPWTFEYDAMRSGLLRFGVGLFRKVVVADRLGLYVDAVYADPAGHGGTTLMLATYAYALQIYFDFSGYTDMAIGVGHLFGVRLTENFRTPYLATSVAEFWRRWHISFSRWIFDYLFKPLQLAWRQAGNAGTAAALLLAFLGSGLWHGATWGFVVWGLLHGAYLAASVYVRPWQRRVHRALRLEGTALLTAWQRVATFHLVCLAWVFFRSPSASHALTVLRRIPTLGRPALLAGGFDRVDLGLLAMALPAAWALGRTLPAAAARGALAWSWPARWALYVGLAFATFLFHVRAAGFIYFGF